MGYEKFKVTELFPGKDFRSEFVDDIKKPSLTLYEDIEYAYNKDFPVHETIVDQIDFLELERREVGLIEIKGLMQRIDYLNSIHSLYQMLNVSPELNPCVDDEVCVIHLRGGDYIGSPALLPASYFKNAVLQMKKVHGIKKFKIITNDFKYAKRIFPDFEIIGSAADVHQVEKTNAMHHIGGSILKDYQT